MIIEFNRIREGRLQGVKIEIKSTNPFSSDYLAQLSDYIFNEKSKTAENRYAFPMPRNYNGPTLDHPIYEIETPTTPAAPPFPDGGPGASTGS